MLPVLMEKLNCPGRLSKNGLATAETIRVTGTVMEFDAFVKSVKTICPV